MVPQENGVGLEDIGRMFGGAVFGGSQTGTRDGSSSSNETVRRPREGETMMCWFLRRWAPISDGLFALVEELESSTAVEQEALVSPDVWKPYRNAQGAVIGTPHPLLGGGSQRPPWASRISSDPIIQTKPDKSNAQLNDYFSITSANQKSNLVKFKDPARPKDVELHKVGDMLHEEVDYGISTHFFVLITIPLTFRSSFAARTRIRRFGQFKCSGRCQSKLVCRW